jgi:hypothetical protein
MSKTQTIALLALVGIGGYLWLKKKAVNPQELAYITANQEVQNNPTLLAKLPLMSGDEIHLIYTVMQEVAAGQQPSQAQILAFNQLFSKYGIPLPG